MFSYWEKESFEKYNHIIVGAGIVGLSLSIELRNLYPQSRILVLERGLLPTGASTRNAGFACMGSVTELIDDLAAASEDAVVALFALRKKGLELLRRRLGDDRIGYKADGSYELISDTEYPAIEKLDYLNALLLPVAGKPAFRLAHDKIGQFGFGGGYSKAMIENTCEGGLHTGQMMRALTDLAIESGVEIKTGAEVIGFDDHITHVAVRVRDPFRNEDWALSADTLSICTNAFTRKLLPYEDIIPGRGQVLITDRIPGLKFKGVFHFDKGYYYFREIDGRVLLGGGRNLDFVGETTDEIALSTTIQNELEKKLRSVILPGVSYNIYSRWAGIMAFGSTKEPIVRQVSPHVFGAFRMGGMGVALGSNVAEQLAAIISRALS